MPFTQATCKNCGALLQLNIKDKSATCQYCGTPYIREAINQNTTNQYSINKAKIIVKNIVKEDSCEKTLSNNTKESYSSFAEELRAKSKDAEKERNIVKYYGLSAAQYAKVITRDIREVCQRERALIDHKVDIYVNGLTYEDCLHSVHYFYPHHIPKNGTLHDDDVRRLSEYDVMLRNADYADDVRESLYTRLSKYGFDSVSVEVIKDIPVYKTKYYRSIWHHTLQHKDVKATETGCIFHIVITW